MGRCNNNYIRISANKKSEMKKQTQKIFSQCLASERSERNGDKDDIFGNAKFNR